MAQLTALFLPTKYYTIITDKSVSETTVNKYDGSRSYIVQLCMTPKGRSK